MTNTLDDQLSLTTIAEILDKLGDDPTRMLDAADDILNVLDAHSKTRVDDLAILSLAIANAVENQIEIKSVRPPIVTAMTVVARMLLDDRDEELVDDVCHCPTCGTELVPDEPELVPDEPDVCEYCGAAFDEIDPHCEGNFG